MTDKLVLDSIHKIFTNDHGRGITALGNLSLKIGEGEFVCILGKTGCGKTTLLRILAGLETPTEGEFLIDDKPVTGLPKACTLVFQQYSLFPWLTISQNVEFPLDLAGFRKKDRLEKAHDILDLVGLSGYKQAKPYELSGGMQQRVAIARALAYDPEVLLMDEPFGALDEKTRQQLQNLLLDIWEEKRKTIVFVTHNIDESILLADRIVIMAPDPGRIVDEFDVHLPRPRDRLDDAFTRFYVHLRKTLELSHNETRR